MSTCLRILPAAASVLSPQKFHTRLYKMRNAKKRTLTHRVDHRAQYT